MKLTKLFLGLFALALVCACSNEKIENNTPELSGGEAYITVRLADVNSATRATADGGYENGSKDEYSVKSAHFYFYSAEGVFITEGSAWNGGSAITTGTNIEFKSNTIVVLKGLKTEYPKYMVTVLNKPADFTPENRLEDMGKALSGLGNGTINIGENNYFTMSTSSYYDANNQRGGFYFTTEVSPDDFNLEEPDMTQYDSPVIVYVERLAAKVTLNNALEKTKATVGNITGDLYELKTTVAGEKNDGGSANGTTPTSATETLYIQFNGWKLNATAKDSYMSKNINTAWQHTALSENAYLGPLASNAGDKGWQVEWNKTADFRSFWGKSFNYGTDETTHKYPGSANDLDNNSFATCPLIYYNLKDSNNDFGNSDYCLENTNTSQNLNKIGAPGMTSVILKATIYNSEGKALDYVRYNGLLFTEEHYINHMIDIMDDRGYLPYYTKTGDAEDGYTQIDATKYVVLKDLGDGFVKLVLNDQFSELELFDGNNSGIENDETLQNTINDKLTEVCGENVSNAYKDGQMYYNIPIEHFNNTDITEDNIPEGKYGVVRNHHYKITINKLVNIGTGIYDPEEKIVPRPENDTYYLGATLNILSWKIVNQSVDL